MNREILITGVAGFIGSRVAEMLLSDGHKIVGVDNLNDYYDVGYKHLRLQSLKSSEQFEFHEMDIEDREALAQIFENHSFDAVINLAGRAGVRASLADPHVYFTTNTMGTLNILELMRMHGVRKYVTASTSSIYSGLATPFHEELAVNTPISPYAASKKAAEVLAYTYHYQYDIDVSILRYFTVYGPKGRPDMSILRFIRWIDNEEPIQLYGDGTQARDFTYIDDIARGTILALKEGGYQVYNLGGGNQPVSMNAVIELLEGLVGKKANVDHLEFHKADVDTTWAEIEKADQQLGWRPEIGLEDGLSKTYEWYKANKESLESIEF